MEPTDRAPQVKRQAMQRTDYQCEFCDKSFNSSHQLQSHLVSQRHRDRIQQPDQCHMCQVVFSDFTGEWAKSESNDDKTVQYTDEGLHHYNTPEHQSKMERHKEEALMNVPKSAQDVAIGGAAGAYCCSICNKFFNSVSQMQQHLDSLKHQERTKGHQSKPLATTTIPAASPPQGFSCSNCDKTFNSALQLDQHLLSPKHRAVVEQSEVDKTQQTDGATSKQADPPVFRFGGESANAEAPAESEKFDCFICEMNFNSTEQFLKHVEGMKHQQMVEQPRDCLMCALTFNSENQAQQHYISPAHLHKCELFRENKGRSTSHLKTDEFCCTTCKKYFNSRAQQEQHMMSKQHNSTVKKKDQCAICGVNFNSDMQAAAHYQSPKHQRAVNATGGGQSYHGPGGHMGHGTGFKMNLPVKKAVAVQPSVSYNNIKFTRENGPHSFSCVCCEVTVNSMHQLAQHFTGNVHKLKSAANGGGQADSTPQAANQDAGWSCGEVPGHKGGWFYCQPCNVSVPTSVCLRQHLQSQYHKNQNFDSTYS